VKLAWIVAIAACSAPPRIEQVAQPTAPDPTIELVETTPVETTLDSELRDAADVWPEMIRNARHTIDLAQFYISNGARLEPVIAAIEAAIARGVRVRLLVEQSFVKVYPETLDRLARAGATVRHADFTPGILHAKYFVVDGHDAFFGSQNFDWRALEHNLELGIRTHDAAIAARLLAIFELDWARAGDEPAPRMVVPAASGSIALVASPKDRLPGGIEWELPKLVAAIDSATAQIHVQLLTYRAGDWAELEAPLLEAAARGVHVELMLADWSKRAKTIGGLQKLASVPNVEIRLVTIPIASRGFIPFARVIHAKLLVVDGSRAWLGTSNWEREYFYDSRNVGLWIDDATVAARLDRFWQTGWRSTYAIRVDPGTPYEPPRIE
jgi:phosphatidylserine/phosphatidylglycerophosphate/cardiolipin synthase-like enzyme